MTGDSFSGQIYVVNVETVNSGIPYAESFYVTSNFCLSRVGDKESKLCVVSAIKYKKAVWGLVKSKSHYLHKKFIAGLKGKSLKSGDTNNGRTKSGSIQKLDFQSIWYSNGSLSA